MGTYKQPKFICSMDIETLDTGPRSIVTQVGLVFAPADDPETILKEVLVYLPVDPQISIKRTFSAKTLFFHMMQPDSTRKQFEENLGDDFEELPSLLRHIGRQWAMVVGDDSTDCEIWTRGSDFDITNVGSLMDDCAVERPWRYDMPRDLRTLMALAGLKKADIHRDLDLYPEHEAIPDAKYQLLCYAEATKHLRARS